MQEIPIYSGSCLEFVILYQIFTPIYTFFKDFDSIYKVIIFIKVKHNKSYGHTHNFYRCTLYNNKLH